MYSLISQALERVVDSGAEVRFQVLSQDGGPGKDTPDGHGTPAAARPTGGDSRPTSRRPLTPHPLTEVRS